MYPSGRGPWHGRIVSLPWTVAGAGSDIVLLHGWAAGRGVWDDVAGALARAHRVCRVDLPGHGAASGPLGSDVDAIADAVLAGAPPRAAWIGWSLGGLVALAAAARQPDRLRALHLVACNPRFIAAPDWPGIEPPLFAGFAHDIVGDPVATHDRFLALQVAGSARARTALRALRAARARDGLPATDVLVAGLDLLARTDQRGRLAAVSCPVHAILGALDPLVPAALGTELAAAGVDPRWIPGAGHAPFLSHPDLFMAAVEDAL